MIKSSSHLPDSKDIFMQFAQPVSFLRCLMVSLPVFCVVACTPTKIKKTVDQTTHKTQKNGIKTTITSCPTKMMIYPVERHATSAILPNKDFPVFAGLTVAPDTAPYRALVKNLPEKQAYIALPTALQSTFAPMRKLPIFVYGPDGKSCKLKVGQLYLHHNPPEDIASNVVAQLEGECASFNEKEAPNRTVGVSTLDLAPTCTLNTKLVNVDLAKEQIKWPAPLDKALDMKSCQKPTCEHYHEVKSLKNKDVSVYVVRTTKFHMGEAKPTKIAGDKDLNEAEKEAAIKKTYCDAKKEIANGMVFRMSSKAPYQMGSKDNGEPGFYGWIEDPTGIKQFLFMGFGQFANKTIQDGALKTVQAFKWYAPHPENSGENLSLGPYCGP